MKKNKKQIKKIHYTKIYHFLLFIIILFILSFIIYKFKFDKIAHIRYEKDPYSNENHIFYDGIDWHDLICHLRIDEKYKKDVKLRNKLNEEIDSRFYEQCENEQIYSLDIQDFCNFDSYYHYIEINILLNKLNDTTKDKISKIVKSSYENYKKNYIKTYSDFRDNRLTITLISMKMLNILNESENNFWVRHYSTFIINESQLTFPQVWNIVWAFKELGIENYLILSKYNTSNTNACSYKHRLKDALKQNVFEESTRTLIRKFTIIRNFCGQTLNETEKEELVAYSKFMTDCHS